MTEKTKTSSDKPLVSICIPAYNTAKFLKKSLDSIVNQTYTNREIIVSNNASTDDTAKIVKKYVEKYKIKYFENDKNIGPWRNFERCISLAKGEYIAIFHADDIYMPNIVQKQVEYFQKNLQIGAVFTNANLINGRGEIIGESKLPVELNKKGTYYFTDIFFSTLNNLHYLVCPSVMVKSKIYHELIPFRDDLFETASDVDMWFRISEKYPIAILPEKLMNYRFSNTHETYLIRYLRTVEADYFKVMDYYLANKLKNVNISKNTLSNYEFQRSRDKLKCVINHIIRDEITDAKGLLKKPFSIDIFWNVGGMKRKYKYLFYFLLEVMMSILISFGLIKYVKKILFWRLYQWRRRDY